MNRLPTFKVTIRKDELNASGKSNVKIRVCHKHTRYISTAYYVKPQFFDQKNEMILPGGDMTKDQADRANNRMKIEIGILAGKVDGIRDQLHTIDIKTLMQILRDKRKEYELMALIDDRIARYEKIGNVNYMSTFENTKKVVQDFAGAEVPLKSITADWLKRLEYKMKLNGLQTNSIGVYMRNIRTCYNQAITMGLTDLASYPFRGYRIPKAATRKRNLSAEEIAKIYRAQLKDPLAEWARSMFMLSFFLIGINMKDLFLLKKVEQGRIYYIRSKGKRQYNIQVWPEAQEIIDRYPGKNFLLDAQDRYADYRSATKRINKKMKDIAAKCGIDKPVTTYYVRHSWATIGRSLKIAKDDISMGLGHQRASMEMTEIYIDEEQEIIDQTNRMIIDHVIKLPPGE